MNVFKKVVKWHKTWTYRIQDAYDIDDYDLIWFYYFQGVATVIILQWII
jgi:hypothetical protein